MRSGKGSNGVWKIEKLVVHFYRIFASDSINELISGGVEKLLRPKEDSSQEETTEKYHCDGQLAKVEADSATTAVLFGFRPCVSSHPRANDRCGALHNCVSDMIVR